jgi:hypothetical protein
MESEYYLQAESPPPASVEDTEDQRKADEEAKLMSGRVSALGRRKVAGQTDPKRREFFVLLFVESVVA